jgi:hypothetical protein
MIQIFGQFDVEPTVKATTWWVERTIDSFRGPACRDIVLRVSTPS